MSSIPEEYADNEGSASPYSAQSYLTLPLQPDVRSNNEDSSSSDSPKRGSQSRRKSELVLLGCASVLAAVALGSDLAELVPHEEKRRGIFQWASRGARRSATSPGHAIPPGSVTLISDCNSAHSLIRADSDEAAPANHSADQAGRNLLVDYKVESFKKDPRQSLTPTHVTATRANATATRGHRRTPSDGAIRQVTPGHRRSPSDGSTPPQLYDPGQYRGECE